MNKVKTFFQRVRAFRYSGAILLTVIITVQMTMIMFLFFERRDGYHCDEIYSYGLSNSFYEPYLQCEDVSASPSYRLNEWVDGKDFHNYITVQEGQQFRYDAVWYNQSKDRHPPLFYAVLHTICSFFPDQFSFVYGWVINLCCLAVMQIFLYKLGKRLFHSRYIALLLCLFWGFTPAAVGVTLFIRMYGMLTTFMVMLLYFHAKLFDEDKTAKPLWKLLLPLYFVTLAGAMTQYLFLFGAFVLAVGFCIRYLVQKRWKHFFAYGLTMLSAVLTNFLLVPSAITHLFAEAGHTDGVDFWQQMGAGTRIVLYGLLKANVSDVVWWLTVLPMILLFGLLLCVPILFLFRDRERVKQRLTSLKALPHRIKTGCTPRKIGGRIKTMQLLPPLMVLIIIVIVILTAYTVSFTMAYIERYLYMIFPLTAVLLVLLVTVLFRRLKSGKIWITAVCLLLTGFVLKGYDVPTVMRYDNTINLRQELTGKNVLVMTNDTSHYDQLSAYAYELSETDHVFFTAIEDYQSHLEELRSMYAQGTFEIVFFNARQEEDGHYAVYAFLPDDDGNPIFERCDDIIHQIAEDAQGEYIGAYRIFTADMLVCRVHNPS